LETLTDIPSEFRNPQAILDNLQLHNKNPAFFEVRARYDEEGDGEYVLMVEIGRRTYVLARCVAEGRNLPPIAMTSGQPSEDVSKDCGVQLEGFTADEVDPRILKKIYEHAGTGDDVVVVREIDKRFFPVRTVSCCGNNARNYYSFTEPSRLAVSYLAVCKSCGNAKSYRP
jgi:hypothetical protein